MSSLAVSIYQAAAAHHNVLLAEAALDDAAYDANMRSNTESELSDLSQELADISHTDGSATDDNKCSVNGTRRGIATGSVQCIEQQQARKDALGSSGEKVLEDASAGTLGLEDLRIGSTS